MEIHYFDRHASADEVEDYIDRWGFAVVTGRADPGTIEDIRRDMMRYGRGLRPLDLPFFGGHLKKVEGFAAKSAGLIELLNDPFLTDLAEAFLGAEPILNASGGFILEPGRQAQPLHHDDVLYKPFVPRGTQETMLNFMYAVTPFTAENGATRMVPGSHRWPEGREPAEGDAVIDLVMPPGAFAVWLGSTWHGAGQNRSDALRLGAEIAFNCGWLRPHEAYHLLVPPALARDLPVRVQEVLGYKAHRGMLGCIEQRSPMEVLGFARGTAPVRAVATAGGFVDAQELECAVEDYLAKTGSTLPDEGALLLRRLSETNRTRAATTNRSDLDMLEVVAEAQARALTGWLAAAGLSAPVEALRG